MDALALTHLVVTAFMAGVIVFVQVVHYPLMGWVGAQEFVRYETGHTVRTGWVVVPPMLVELATGVWIAVTRIGTADEVGAGVALALLTLIWVSTAALQAPAHGRLVHGFDAVVHRRLVRTNWIRTVAWIGRVPLAVSLL